MTARRLVITLHWVSFLLVCLIWSTTPDWPLWLTRPFVAVAFAFAALYVIRRGPHFKPGPKLEGWTRTVHRLQHHLLYFSLVALALVFLIGLPERTTYVAVQLVFFGGLMHGCFHAWRHTALYDGALRNVTPRFAHRIL